MEEHAFSSSSSFFLSYASAIQFSLVKLQPLLLVRECSLAEVSVCQHLHHCLVILTLVWTFFFPSSEWRGGRRFSRTNRESSLATMWYVPKRKRARCGTRVLTAVFLGWTDGRSQQRALDASLCRFLRKRWEGRRGAFRPTFAVFLRTFARHSAFLLFPFSSVYSDYASLASLAHSAKHVPMISPLCVSLMMSRFFFTCFLHTCKEHSPKTGVGFRRRVHLFSLACVSAMFYWSGWDSAGLAH